MGWAASAAVTREGMGPVRIEVIEASHPIPVRSHRASKILEPSVARPTDLCIAAISVGASLLSAPILLNLQNRRLTAPLKIWGFN